MLLSDSLEVAIGLSFIFTMLSLVLTSFNELIEAWVKMRGRKLFDAMAELLAHPPSGRASGTDAAATVYRHPLLQGLMRGAIQTTSRGKLPSYVPSRNFALALIDQARTGRLALPQPVAAVADGLRSRASLPSAASPAEQLRFAAEGIANPQVRRLLLQAVDLAGDDMDAVAAHLAGVYDSAMDRVSGWYKRYTQAIIFALGLALAVLLNVNTLTIANSLSQDATLRRAIVEQAGAVNRDGTLALSGDQASSQIDKTGLPLGWTRTATDALMRPAKDSPVLGWVEIALGFLLTAFAASLGAPFWFDVLNRLMVIRATVKPTEKSRDEAPQDPQPSVPGGASTIVVVQPDAVPALKPPATPGAIDTEVYAEDDPGPRLYEEDDGAPVEALQPPVGGEQ